MVATFPNPDNSPAANSPAANSPNLFKYLKRCQPLAPDIASGATPNLSTASTGDPFDQPPPLSKRRRRVFSLLLGATQAAAISLGLWAAALPHSQLANKPSTASAMVQQSQDDPQRRLWNALGSDALTQALQTAKQQQTEAALTAAEQQRLQAQQLRLDAEAKAKMLVDQAADQARQKTVAAVRRADEIALDATYVGAEQVIYAEAGSDITLKFTARIQCKDGPFGETAVAAPADSRIVPREVRNLAVCHPSPETAAGKPIGQAGEWGVAFFKLE